MPREMRADRLREMSLEELKEKLRDTTEELFNMKFRNSMKQLDNPLKIREARRNIARLKTILKQVEMGVTKIAAHGEAK